MRKKETGKGLQGKRDRKGWKIVIKTHLERGKGRIIRENQRNCRIDTDYENTRKRQ